MDTQKWLRLQEKAGTDPRFQHLQAEYDLRDRQLQRAMETMDRDQRDAVTDYIGLIIEMHMQLLRLSWE